MYYLPVVHAPVVHWCSLCCAYQIIKCAQWHYALSCPTSGERIVAALYGQSKELPASLFDLGISPHINANIIIAILLILPKELVSFSWLDRLREARKEGKGVSSSSMSAAPAGQVHVDACPCNSTYMSHACLRSSCTSCNGSTTSTGGLPAS